MWLMSSDLLNIKTPFNLTLLDKVRLDKWLWAARFFKTRSLALTAIKRGKVSVNGQHPKAGRELAVGDTLTIRQGQEIKTVIVRALAGQRGPAVAAQQLYEETRESIKQREKERELRQYSSAQRPRGEGRPTKRQRRKIHRFTRSG
jgi:ribosome-associated heat shock protein Hsp15